MNEFSYFCQELKNNLHILQLDFKSLDLPTDLSGFRCHFKYARNKCPIRLLEFLFRKLDEDRYMRSMDQLILSYSRSNEVKLKNVCLQWLKELSSTSSFSIMFSRFWSPPSPEIAYPFLCWLSSLVLKRIYKFDYLSTTKTDNDTILDATEIHIQSVMTTLSSLCAIEKQAYDVDRDFQAKIKPLELFLQEKSNYVIECMQLLNLEETDNNILFQTLLDEMYTFQKSRWNQLSMLKCSLHEAFLEWSSFRPIFMDFFSLATVSSRDRCLDFSCFEKPRSLAKMTQSETLDLVNLLNEGASCFHQADNYFCSVNEHDYPSYPICEAHCSLSASQTADSSSNADPSADLSWCILATSRAVRNCTSSTDQELTNLSLQNTTDYQLVSDNILLSSPAKLSSTLDKLVHSLKLLIVQEEENWCYSPGKNQESGKTVLLDSSIDSVSSRLAVPLKTPIKSNKPLIQQLPLSNFSSPYPLIDKFDDSGNLQFNSSFRLDGSTKSSPYSPDISAIKGENRNLRSRERTILGELFPNSEGNSYAPDKVEPIPNHENKTMFIYYPDAAPVSSIEFATEQSTCNTDDSCVDFLDGDTSFTSHLLPPSP